MSERYPNDPDQVLLSLGHIFNCLPIACTINGKILCVHGCVPVGIENLDFLEQIDLPYDPLQHDAPFADDVKSLLWSDPISDEQAEKQGLVDAVLKNPRGIGQLVRERDINKFLDENGFQIILRGHQAP